MTIVLRHTGTCPAAKRSYWWTQH